MVRWKVPSLANERSTGPFSQIKDLEPRGSSPMIVEQVKNKKSKYLKGTCFLVRWKGLEPPTYWFVASHSIQLSYQRTYAQLLCLDNITQKLKKCNTFFIIIGLILNILQEYLHKGEQFWGRDAFYSIPVFAFQG